jgi:hypothetical protein
MLILISPHEQPFVQAIFSSTFIKKLLILSPGRSTLPFLRTLSDAPLK